MVTEEDVVKALPDQGFVRNYVIHAMKQTTAPLCYHLGVGLTILSTTCPVNYGMWYAGALRANLFTLVVGRSGEDNKSSALNVGQRILFQSSPDLIGDYPGSAEGLIDSLGSKPVQVIPISEFGRFLSQAQGGYFEQIKTLLADLWDCLSSDTEILTENGWCSYQQVNKGDLVYALDTDTNELVLTAALDVRERPLGPDERMVELKGHYHDIKTTEGHRFYIKYRDPNQGFKPSQSWLVKTGKEMLSRKSAYYLPFSAMPSRPLTIDCKEHTPSEIENAAKELLYIKDINQENFVDYWNNLVLIHGEQYKYRKDGVCGGLFRSTDKSFIDQLQADAVRFGFSTQYGVLKSEKGDVYRMSIGTRRLVCSDPGNKKSVKFQYAHIEEDEKVWCVTNKHGTLVTRRNGKVVILGNCGPVQRARANGRVTRIENPRLSIMAACSIPYLEKHTLSEDWSGGFMGRWAVLYGQRTRVDPDPVGDRTYVDWLVNELSRRATNANAGWCTGLNPEARKLWNAWYHDLNSRRLPSHVMGVRSRAPTLARKVALLYGWDFGQGMMGQDWEMGVDVLAPAIKFAELHIKSLVGLSGKIADHPDARLRRQVLQAMEFFGNRATLGQIVGNMKMRKRPIVEILDSLLEEGKVRKIADEFGMAYVVVD